MEKFEEKEHLKKFHKKNLGLIFKADFRNPSFSKFPQKSSFHINTDEFVLTLFIYSYFDTGLFVRVETHNLENQLFALCSGREPLAAALLSWPEKFILNAAVGRSRALAAHLDPGLECWVCSGGTALWGGFGSAPLQGLICFNHWRTLQFLFCWRLLFIMSWPPNMTFHQFLSPFTGWL